MKWQFLSDWSVPVFIGVQCIFVKKGLKSCKKTLPTVRYILIFVDFLGGTLISMLYMVIQFLSSFTLE